jgi:ubiquitin C-terminal hydrolase
MVPLVESAMLNMRPPVWDHFSKFILAIEPSRVMYDLAIKHFDCPYFRRIFARLLTTTVAEGSAHDRFAFALSAFTNDEEDGILTALSDLVDGFASDFVAAPDLVTCLLDRIRRRDVPKGVMSPLRQLALSLASLSEVNGRVVDSFIDEVCRIETDRWSLSPPERNSHGLCGLRSLGATCYLNSVFQVLFRIPAFQRLLLQAESESGSDLCALQRLLHYVLKSRRPACDVSEFVRVWKGWDKKPIDPGEQQDANEFLQLLLEQLPDSIQALFRGEITNIIDSCDGSKLDRTVAEPFWSIGLTVKGVDSLDEALALFLRRESLVGENQYDLGDGRKIDATKEQKFKQLPPVLVLQFKRFEYGANGKPGAKLGTRFTFRPSLTVPLADSTTRHYELHGVILHAGEVTAGHYSSIVRLDGYWVTFNDTEVKETNLTELEQASFGGTVDVRTAAYLVFYIDPQAAADGHGILSTGPLSFSQPILEEITADDARFSLESCAFGLQSAKIVLERAKMPQLLDFYFNVFCHSRHESLAPEFSDRLTDRCDDSTIGYLITNFVTKIAPVYHSCSIAPITKSLSTFVTHILSKSALDQALALADLFVSHLGTIAASWRPMPEVCGIILSFLSLGEARIEAARAHGWVGSLAVFLGAVFGEPHGDIFLESCDCSALFDALTLLATRTDVETLQGILPLYSRLAKSKHHVRHVEAFLLRGVELHLYKLSDILALMPNQIPSGRLLELEIAELSCETIRDGLKRLRANTKWSTLTVIAALMKSEPMIRDALLEHTDALFEWFSSQSSHNEALIELIQKLCDADSDRVLAHLRALFAGNTAVSPRLMRLTLSVLRRARYPRDVPFAGLIDRPDSPEKHALLVYFGHVDVVKWFTGQFSGHNYDFPSRARAMVDVIDALSDQDFLMIIDHEKWQTMITLMAKPNGEAAFKVLDALISVLVARQSLGEKVHQSLIALIAHNFTAYSLAKVIHRLREVQNFVADDLPRLNEALMCASRGNIADAKTSTMIIVECILPLLRDHVVKLSYDASTVASLLYRIQSAEMADAIWRYVTAVAIANPESRTKLADAVCVKNISRSPAVILFAARLTISERKLSDGAVAEQLIAYHMKLSDKEDELRPLFWTTYREWLGNGDGPLTTDQRSFLRKLFPIGACVSMAERAFFAEALKRLEEPDVAELIQQSCKSMASAKAIKSTLLAPARRVAFLAGTVWPARRVEIVRMVGADAVETALTLPEAGEFRDVFTLDKQADLASRGPDSAGQGQPPRRNIGD